MKLHLSTSGKGFSLSALASAVLLLSCSTLAADLPESQFQTKPVGHGLYELAFDGTSNTLFAASTPSFAKEKNGGIVFRVNPATLATDANIVTKRRAFATALDEQRHLLYIGNTVDGSVTVIDTQTGKELATIQLNESVKEDQFVPTRELVLDKKNQRLYVSGTAQKGVLWVIDTAKREKIATLGNMGEYPTGIALDSERGHIYCVNGRGELITLDATSHKILKRVVVEPTKKHFFLNIALDSKTGRAFITDPDLPNVLVVDVNSGKILHQIDVINSLAVLFNPLRSEIYITHREAKRISIVDSNSYQVKNSITTQALPNSLALSSDGQQLFASIKQSKEEMEKKQDYLIKINLGGL
ncbi:YncE family protein [Serratia liquefaciens]|uniref:7-bladed beta-propeller protein YncE n=1 Tax=Serratia liquefaciens TaxID=614 RepID=UPI0022B9504A|nr:YncE family protein [Serratia liquefaciens]WBL74017.1 YncE family protein [Serratia liquefaciens]